MMKSIEIRKGFDGHFHPRHGNMMECVLPCTTEQFAGGVAMGNLPGELILDTVAKNSAYRQEIIRISPEFNAVVPLMVTKELITNWRSSVPEAKRAGIINYKFLPALTTNGPSGLTLYDLYTPEAGYFLESLVEAEAVFCGHFEVGTHRIYNGAPVPIIKQETEAIRFLQFLLEAHPNLKVVVEHASTAAMIAFIESLPEEYQIAATLTPQHAVINYEDVCDNDGNIRQPLNYCKPVAKEHHDLRAVQRAMCSGNPRFFAGTDSAPHWTGMKLKSKSAGIFSAPVALQTYAEIFEKLERLEQLENFTSVFGPQFYGIDPSEEKLTLIRIAKEVPKWIFDVPIFRGGESISWSIVQ